MKTCKTMNSKLIDELDKESGRFRELAQKLSLCIITNPGSETPDKIRQAKEHLVRAETYKAAAALALKFS